jgi:hypothetical protein
MNRFIKILLLIAWILVTSCGANNTFPPLNITVTPTPIDTITTASFDGISIIYNKSIASNVIVGRGEYQLEIGSGWPPLPFSHIQFDFENYPATSKDPTQTPKISVYDRSDFDDKALALEKLLEDKSLPRLGDWVPPTSFYTGQVLQSRVEYLTFDSGEGVRFIAQYSELYPVVNSMLIYNFNGLTSDGKYYISAVFPVSVPFAPDTVEEITTIPTLETPNSVEDVRALFKAIEEHNAEIEGKMDMLEDSDFTPNLDLLDSIIQSIVIR